MSTDIQPKIYCNPNGVKHKLICLEFVHKTISTKDGTIHAKDRNYQFEKNSTEISYTSISYILKTPQNWLI